MLLTVLKSLLVLLQGVAHLGNDAFVDTISEVCIETGVCRLSLK